MNILIAGASGFIGSELTKTLSKKYQITVLGRSIKRLEKIFPSNINKVSWENLTSHDAKYYDLIINLSGSNIGAKRWNEAVKKELIESRTLTNKKLTEWLIKWQARPRYFCANAIGIYGAEEISTKDFDEDSPLYNETVTDFLKHIGLMWQESLKEAEDYGIPVTTLRFGVVLKKGEGMLKKLELPFRLGLGSILGAGQQTISWVYYQDLIEAIIFLIEHKEIIGPLNITAPQAISQKEFAKQYAKVLNRPLFLTMPANIIKLLFGEMGEELLLKGQKVVPKRLIQLGFQFKYPSLESALTEEYTRALSKSEY
ncbi:MAG: TIGR01777 family oxidoreductase [Proteobacteria bacterium]|nr:TIGR01777 family oxidoreductase [Pseudomonadota bacterium]